MFHRRCGERVKLANGDKTAVRNFLEFNYGLVLSSKPLVENQLFEVRIDKKINSWSGSIEIGVTALDPETMDFPSSATDLRNGSWIMSGNSILKDGRSIADLYGMDLDKLQEGDLIGVMRTADAELVFYVNGVCQGVAAVNLPERLFAIVDLYGKCAQVTIVSDSTPPEVEDASESEMEINNDRAMITSTTDLVANLNVNMNIEPLSSNHDDLPENPLNDCQSRLQFHEQCGTLVKLSANNRTAERRRPLDEFNNGVVMTHRPLRNNELFEIRIDRLVEKWSGSIEVGITAHNPTALEFPATMTNMRSGTTMMSGCGILTNGKGTKREYGQFNLDELREGDRIGMMRKTNGNLHYFINGLDQGVAATKVLGCIWGVVDLYGMTVKVTIVDRDEREEQNLITRRNTTLNQIMHGGDGLNDCPEEDAVDRLMFHSNCGTHAAVINNARSAHRPNAMDDFNNGVVLTNRPLKPNELFEVRLDKMVTKWAGSIEIGVTTHLPTSLEYPSTMTNVRSGTWMMTGNGVMHNGTTIIDDYGQNLDRLQVGDRVGVMRKESGTVHFFVNGIDQGAAATAVPERVYGVIDLYGQAAKATILDTLDCYSPDTVNSSLSNTILYSDLRFHHVHGKNARISNYGLTASRPRAFGEFNDAIVISSRALREGEMFEFTIEKMVDRWSGSIEAGVTAIRPEDLDFPGRGADIAIFLRMRWLLTLRSRALSHDFNLDPQPGTMTDITHDTWMLSGSTVMQDGLTLRNGYACDLDMLVAGTKIGMMRHPDTTLHFYVDGVDQGAACAGVPTHVYAVIDLYGQCAQVALVQPALTIPTAPSEASVLQSLPHAVTHSQPATESIHRFNTCCGKNVVLSCGSTSASRVRNYSHALAFSSAPLEPDEVFEVAIQERHAQWAGTLRMGVTTLPLTEHYPAGNLPPVINSLLPDTWFISGNEVRKNGATLKSNYCHSLDWLVVGSRVGVKRSSDGALSFLLNGEDMGIAVANVPKRVFAVVDLYGSAVSVSVTSSRCGANPTASEAAIIAGMECSLCSSRLHDSLEMLRDTTPTQPNKSLDPCSESFGEYLETAPWSDSHLDVTPDVLGPAASTSAQDVEVAPPAPLEFHENHGRNVQLGEDRLSARRVASYNQGLVISAKPLLRGQLFQVRIDALNNNWVSSIMCGVTNVSPEKAHFPVTALGLKKQSWVVSSDCVFHNGVKLNTTYGPNLDNLQSCHIVGVLIDSEARLHLFVNGIDQGIAAVDIPPQCHAVVDLYGRCEQVTLLNSAEEVNQAIVVASLSRSVHAMSAHSMSSHGMEDQATQVESESLSEKADSECHEKEKQFEEPVVDKPGTSMPGRATGHPDSANTRTGHNDVQPFLRPSSQNQNQRSLNHELMQASVELQSSNSNQHSGSNQAYWPSNQQTQTSNQELAGSRSFNESIQNLRAIDVQNLPATFSNPNTIHNTNIKQLSISNSSPTTPSQNSPVSNDSNINDNNTADSNTTCNEPIDSYVPDELTISNESHSLSENDSNVIINNSQSESNANLDSVSSVIPPNKLAISSLSAPNASHQIDSNTVSDAGDETSHSVPTVSNSNKNLSDDVDVAPNANTIANLSIANKPSHSNEPILNLNTITNLSIASKSCNSNALASSHVSLNELPVNPNTLVNLSIANKPSNANVISNESVITNQNTLVNLSIANKPSNDNVISNDTNANIPVIHNKPANSIVVPNANTLTNLSIRLQHPANLSVGCPTPMSVTPLPGLPSGPATPVLASGCEYLATCTRFRHMMGLPDGFFLYEPACYCEGCAKLRGGEMKPGGAGWCRFPLRRRPGADLPPDKWHLAFYGARLADLRRILDHGQLLLPGELGLERNSIGLHKDKSKEDVSDGTQLTFSPSLQYAEISVSKMDEYIDPSSKKSYIAHAAFQILVKPGSFKVSPSSLGSQQQLSEDVIEWVTKERGATSLCSLFVKLEAVNNGARNI